jgi:hypothetical protein
MEIPPPATYLGESLYADWDSQVGMLRVWASDGSNHSLPMYFSPDTLSTLLQYAVSCYVKMDIVSDANGSLLQ